MCASRHSSASPIFCRNRETFPELLKVLRWRQRLYAAATSVFSETGRGPRLALTHFWGARSAYRQGNICLGLRNVSCVGPRIYVDDRTYAGLSFLDHRSV